jgi:nucleoside-diphosphate-sugar epimerase
LKVLVTGASGFIGHHLVRRLSRVHEVFAVMRDSNVAAFGETVSIIASDLAGPLQVEVMPAEMDIIIHLAQANGSFPEAATELFAVNTSSTQQLLQYGREAGARQFILASSGDVYGNCPGPCRETETAVPESFYAVTKYAAELLVQSYSAYLRPCILRFFHPYGAGQSNRLIGKLADRIRSGDTVQIHQGDCPHLTPIYIDDVIRAVESATSSAYAGVVNIAGDRVVSMRELAVEIGAVVGREPKFEETGEETGDLIGDNRLMKELFGAWPMVPLAAGLSLALTNKEDAGCLTRV